MIEVAGKDITTLLNTMKARFGPDCLKTAIILGINAILMAIMITFLIPALMKFRFDDDDKAAKEKEEQEAAQGTPGPQKF